ncbi:3-keto-5-aminohexanoate cleavage protein [Dactylosporangium sp. NBC_01737]|uniref:3-keto-5-aminohexanoate cleavage protein n=1 Tax=Dactylosporangium sp. NBC_01737 TaxID=2975959 RepID=UPI002E0EE803|nr:3-keto-5-aminohexanoate cleavage protein [Dactylosporangium sp. NBC_01737]
MLPSIARIKVALNGGRLPGAHPALPCTPAELAVAARDAVAAGAEAVHLHPRDADGRESLDAADVGAAVAAVPGPARPRRSASPPGCGSAAGTSPPGSARSPAGRSCHRRGGRTSPPSTSPSPASPTWSPPCGHSPSRSRPASGRCRTPRRCPSWTACHGSSSRS